MATGTGFFIIGHVKEVPLKVGRWLPEFGKEIGTEEYFHLFLSHNLSLLQAKEFNRIHPLAQGDPEAGVGTVGTNGYLRGLVFSSGDPYPIDSLFFHSQNNTELFVFHKGVVRRKLYGESCAGPAVVHDQKVEVAPKVWPAASKTGCRQSCREAFSDF